MAVPGMVTPNVVGSTYQAMTPQDYAEQNRLREEKERKRETANAAVMAQRNAEQQARQNTDTQARVKAAFNQTYGPQLQRAYQDTAVQSAKSNSAAGKARDWAIGHGFTSGGTVGQPGTDITAYAAGALQQPKMRPDQIQNTLDYMWRGQTDPYLRTADQVMGNMMKMFHPSDEPAKEWGRTLGKGPSGGSRKSTTKPQEEQPGGIDWWKKVNT